MGGQQQGFIDISDFHRHFKSSMPGCFDADLALEMFREVDSDKDGKLSYKDFNDCMRFQL
jgi:Ca2+-binding EF-hand superfamily protein